MRNNEVLRNNEVGRLLTALTILGHTLVCSVTPVMADNANPHNPVIENNNQEGTHRVFLSLITTNNNSGVEIINTNPEVLPNTDSHYTTVIGSDGKEVLLQNLRTEGVDGAVVFQRVPGLEDYKVPQVVSDAANTVIGKKITLENGEVVMIGYVERVTAGKVLEVDGTQMQAGIMKLATQDGAMISIEWVAKTPTTCDPIVITDARGNTLTIKQLENVPNSDSEGLPRDLLYISNFQDGKYSGVVKIGNDNVYPNSQVIVIDHNPKLIINSDGTVVTQRMIDLMTKKIAETVENGFKDEAGNHYTFSSVKRGFSKLVISKNAIGDDVYNVVTYLTLKGTDEGDQLFEQIIAYIGNYSSNRNDACNIPPSTSPSPSNPGNPPKPPANPGSPKLEGIN